MPDKPVHRERERKHEQKVRGSFPHVENVPGAARKGQPGHDPGPPPVKEPTELRGQKNRSQSRERRPETDDPFLLPESAKRKGGEPEIERGLFEIGKTVVMGNDPISPCEHFPGYGRIEPFVGIEEIHGAQPPEKKRNAHNRNKPEPFHFSRFTFCFLLCRSVGCLWPDVGVEPPRPVLADQKDSVTRQLFYDALLTEQPRYKENPPFASPQPEKLGIFEEEMPGLGVARAEVQSAPGAPEHEHLPPRVERQPGAIVQRALMDNPILRAHSGEQGLRHGPGRVMGLENEIKPINLQRDRAGNQYQKSKACLRRPKKKR